MVQFIEILNLVGAIFFLNTRLYRFLFIDLTFKSCIPTQKLNREAQSIKTSIVIKSKVLVRFFQEKYQNVQNLTNFNYILIIKAEYWIPGK